MSKILSTVVTNPHPYGPPVPQPEADISRIIYIVAREWGVRVADMLSDRRGADVTLPRHVAMHLARRHTKCSLPVIGAAFGGRDHTTVLYAVNKMDRTLKSDATLARRVSLISRRWKLPYPERWEFARQVAADLLGDLRYAVTAKTGVKVSNREPGQ